MNQIDTDTEAVERSESTWLFAQPKADAQATTPTLIKDGGAHTEQKVPVSPVASDCQRAVNAAT